MNDTTTKQGVDPKVIDRIRKLMALAADGSGATEHEAQAAAARAADIMKQHGLSTAQLEAGGGTGEGRAKQEVTKGATEWRWTGQIALALAETTFCFVELVKRHDRAGRPMGSGFRIIGRESAVATVMVTFDYLVSTVQRLTREQTGLERRKFFQRGVAERLAERIREQHRAAMEEQARKEREAAAAARHPGATSTAVVVRFEDYERQERELNEDARRGYAPGTTKRKREEWERQQAEDERRKNELIAEGVDPDVVDWMVDYGYDRERAEARVAERRAAEAAQKPETDAQRRRREEREERESDRYWAKQRRRAAERQSPDWQAGRRAGERVSLNRQVDGKGSGRLS